MNLIERYLSEMSRKTGISVSLVDKIPEDVPPYVYKLLQTRAASGWYDAKKDCVCLYSPNLQPRESDISSNVAFLYIREKGLIPMMKDGKMDFCRELVKDFYHGADLLSGPELEKMAGDYIAGIRPDDMEKWGRVAELASKYSGFQADPKMARTISAGCQSYKKKCDWEARMSNDHGSVDKAAKENLGNYATERINVSLGRCSDPFLRVGYPETELRIRSGNVRDFLHENGFLMEDGPNLSELIQNPVAILKGERRAGDEKTPLHIVVTDHFEPGKGYLTFGIDAPESVLAGYGDGNVKVNVRSVRYMSEYALLSSVTKDNGVNIAYLKPGKTHGYEISSYLRGMEGRSFSELGKKGGDGTTPVYNPLSESRRLRIVANIVENFKNPMASDARRNLFGGILFDDNLRKREAVREELKALSQKPVAGYVPKPEISSKSKNARAVYYTDKDFSAAAVRKLRKSGIHTAFDIMTYGKERFAADFGSRAFKSAVEFLDRNNFSFMNHCVIRKIDEADFRGRDLAGRFEVVQKDMYNILSGFNTDNLSKPVHFPRRIDGSYIEGAGAFTLIAKSMELARWRECNVFITRDQAEQAGIQINRTAVPTYVAERGDVTPYYNLSETSFALERTESFEMLKADALRRTPEVDRYAKTYISLLSGPGDPSFSIEHIDATYAKHYANRKDMANDGSFVKHLETTIPERLATFFKEGFKQGKAEGISMMTEMGQKQQDAQVRTQSQTRKQAPAAKPTAVIPKPKAPGFPKLQ